MSSRRVEAFSKKGMSVLKDRRKPGEEATRQRVILTE